MFELKITASSADEMSEKVMGLFGILKDAAMPDVQPVHAPAVSESAETAPADEPKKRGRGKAKDAEPAPEPEPVAEEQPEPVEETAPEQPAEPLTLDSVRTDLVGYLSELATKSKDPDCRRHDCAAILAAVDKPKIGSLDEADFPKVAAIVAALRGKLEGFTDDAAWTATRDATIAEVVG